MCIIEIPTEIMQAQQQPSVQTRQSLLDEFSFEEPPIINMKAFFDRENNPSWEEECRKVAYSFHKFGICVVRDPRVQHDDNDNYIDMVERYFEHVSEPFYAGEPLKDARPELSYQTGVTPESMEKARDHEAIAARLEEEDKPLTMYP